ANTTRIACEDILAVEVNVNIICLILETKMIIYASARILDLSIKSKVCITLLQKSKKASAPLYLS
ncbi:MAG: hypothetical protein M3264_06755, partial [Thermoproteota archaeon]|nr:hypothetical protein [Thermoproteota archaeon]